jgi:dihydrofolate reductase
VIGGAELYRLALPLADELLLTEIDAEFPADTWFPHWDRSGYSQASRVAGAGSAELSYDFVRYVRNAPL